MPGLLGSRWASKSPKVFDQRTTDIKYPSVPAFGFSLPVITPVKTLPPALAGKPVSLSEFFSVDSVPPWSQTTSESGDAVMPTPRLVDADVIDAAQVSPSLRVESSEAKDQVVSFPKIDDVFAEDVDSPADVILSTSDNPSPSPPIPNPEALDSTHARPTQKNESSPQEHIPSKPRTRSDIAAANTRARMREIETHNPRLRLPTSAKEVVGRGLSRSYGGYSRH
ncbi:hypothetical protein P153DRAFT_383451 [Dothidotthia symphoricarpi CBS 119687]|uniref:Uncharacterized protein n=1 Tax=Dothidotthia symphoricarpi CBS 119687 TaxID=1392245 RepID=A0A6A6AHR0_9PLEO|nr:uncharacterized protein P153DRAFT_383451 [Dothidotthia symphoricarpi CBS 119687]KAF2131340.1 hypothetical protein P153DRAFT_383451 [Dothidotthia symphoricarpi CBS 119687]